MILRLALGALRASQAPAAPVLQHLESMLMQTRCESTSAAAAEAAASSSGEPSTSSTPGGAAAAAAAAAPAPQRGPWLDPSRPRVLPGLLPPPPKPRPLPLLDALAAIKAGSTVMVSAPGRDAPRAVRRRRFDETVEAHVRLKVDARRGDQMVRGAAVLPHSAGRPVRVAVFAEGEAAEAARAAGADVVGGEELVDALIESKGKAIDFNRAVAHPDMMRALVRAGKILGPKGLMPNPKVGTLTTDVAAAVREMRRGRVEFKMDRTAIVHAPIGKVSMDPSQLYANMGALTAALMRAKPEAIKGGLPKYVASVSLASTMGRGVPVEPSSLLAAMDAAAAAMDADGGGGGAAGAA